MKYFPLIIKPPWVNTLAFYVFLGSGACIILLWPPDILGRYFNSFAEIITATLPWLLVCLNYSWQVFTAKKYRVEIALIITLMILGGFNVFLSDRPSWSVSSMRVFELTGLLALWTSLFLFTDQRRLDRFDWFCSGSLAIIAVVELFGFLGSGGNKITSFQIFSNHPIPLCTMIILLSPGPLHLVLSKNIRMQISGWLSVILASSVFALSGKRGPLVALGAMLLVWLGYRHQPLRYLILSVFLMMLLILPFTGSHLVAHLNPKFPAHASILQRLEQYPFAWHIWKQHPVMGIGLRSWTHANYLSDYQQHLKNLSDFPQAVVHLQTFDNMFLTGLVELGTIMTLIYLGLVIYILVRYCLTLRSMPEPSAIDWYRVLVMIGFAVHSLTYDSLLFPSVNWLFHVQLGIMVAYSVPKQAPG
jgi:hypothetical protein